MWPHVWPIQIHAQRKPALMDSRPAGGAPGEPSTHSHLSNEGRKCGCVACGSQPREPRLVSPPQSRSNGDWRETTTTTTATTTVTTI